MSDLNTVIIQGRIVRNAKIRFVPSGKKVADFTIASNRARRTEEGKYEDVGEYFNISAFVSSDDFAKYLVKGQPLIVEGFLKQDKWETDDGKRRIQNNIGTRRIHLIFPKKNREETEQEQIPPIGPESKEDYTESDEIVFDSENYPEDIFIGDGAIFEQ